MNGLRTNGWVKLPRDLTNTWIWNEDKKFDKLKAFLDLLYSANYEDKEVILNGEKVLIGKGSILTSIIKLSKRWVWDRKTVRRYLELLKQDGYIDYERHGKGTIITFKERHNDAVLNFFAPISGQENPDNDTHKAPHNDATIKEYKNKEKEENNNSKEEVEEEKIIFENEEKETATATAEFKKTEYAKDIFLTDAEYDLLKGRYGKADTDKAIEIVSDYKRATGKTYPSDFYAITKWGLKAVAERRVEASPECDYQKPKEGFDLLVMEDTEDEFEKRMWDRANNGTGKNEIQENSLCDWDLLLET